MQDSNLSREELLAELDELRRRVEELEAENFSLREQRPIGHDAPDRKASDRIDDLFAQNPSEIREIGDDYRAVVESAGDAICITQDGVLKFCNPASTQLTGYSTEELVSRHFHTLTHPDDIEELAGLYLIRLRGEYVPPGHRFRIITREGEVKWVESSSASIKWEGRPAVLSLIRDVTQQVRADERLRQAHDELDRRVGERTSELQEINEELVAEIIQREQAEKALRDSEQRFRTLAEASFEGIAVSEKGMLLDVNDQFATMLGYEPRELVGKAELGFISPEHRDLVEKAQSAGLQEPYEHPMLRKDGTKFPVEIRASSASVEDRQVRITAIRDITERRRVEETLRETNVVLEALIKGSPAAIIALDPKGNVKLWNPAAERTFGWSEAEALGKPIPYVPQDKIEECQKLREDVLRGGTFRGLEIRRRKKDGSPIDLSISAGPLHDAEGNVSGIMTVNIDITERKRDEEKLRFAQFAIDNSAEAAFWLRADGLYTYVNEAACRSLGYSREELLGLRVQDIDPNYSAERWDEHWRETKESGSCTIETHHKRKDGRLFPVEVRINFVEFEGQEYHCSFASDITERKRSERALRESMEKFRSIVENSLAGIFTVDDAYRFIYVNDELCRILGHSREELLGLDFRETLTDDSRALVTDRYIRRQCGEEIEPRYIIDVVRGDGNMRHVEMSVAVVRDASGVPCTMGQLVDITESKRAEEALRESEERLRLAWDTSPDCFSISRLKDGSVVDVNRGFNKLTGYTRDEVVGRSSLGFRLWVDPDDRAKLISALTLDGEVRGFETKFRRKEGEIRTIEISAGIMTLGGEPHFLAIMKDIEDSKRAQAALARSEELFRKYFELGLVGMALTSPEKGWVHVNDRICEMLGYTREELLQTTWTALTHPDDLEYDLAQFNRMLAGEMEGYSVDKRFVRKDGELVYTTLHVSCIRKADGTVDHVIANLHDVTDRKRANEALRKSEQLLRQVLDTIPVRLFWKNTESVYLGCNRLFALDSGLQSPEELVGKTDFDMVWREQALQFRDEDRQIMESVTAKVTYEALKAAPEGLQIWVRACKVPLLDPDGRIKGVLGTYEDITESKQAEEAMRQSEQKYRELVQNANSIILRWNPKGELTFLNEFGQHFFGYSEEEIVGQHVVGTIVPETESGGRDLRPLMIQICENPSSFEHNINENMLRDGSRVWIDWTNKAIFDEQSQLIEILSVGTDITERRRTESAIRNIVAVVSSEIGSKFFDSITTHFASTLGADCTFIGERIEKEGVELIRTLSFCLDGQISDNIEYPLTGSPCEMVMSKGLCSYPRDVQIEFPRDTQLLKWGAEGCVAVELSDSSGMPLGVMAALYRSPIKDLEFAESILQIFAARAAAEIDRKRVEEERLRLVTAIEQAGESILITDPAGRILYANPAFTETTGYSVHETRGETAAILNSGKHNQAFYEDMWSTMHRGEVWRGRFANEKKDGSVFDETVTISPVKDKAGHVRNYVMVGRDVTSEIMLQKQLLQAQKMEAIGTLAGGIAHDFNNLLQAVLGYTDLLLMHKDPGDPDRQKLEIIHHAARDGADLVSRILTFSRKADAKVRPINLNEEIRRVEKLLRRTVPKMIEIELVLADDLRTIDADPAQIEQVLLNLAVNARHAMPAGGKLLIETTNVSLSDDYLRAHLDAKPGKHVLLTVSDTGAGMEPEVLDRIFEPFFTTKTNDEGTGLGLSMVHGIVSQHGGYIRCYSEPGGGTSFRIYLPVSASDLIYDPSLTRQMPAFGTETILLVDDDDRVREMGRQVIEMGGYQVIVARSGEEALELYGSHGVKISLIILDLIMPGMGGTRCLAELLRIDPEVKVLVASGYSSNGLAKDEKGIGARGFISKPYDAKDILGAIRRVLDHGQL